MGVVNSGNAGFSALDALAITSGSVMASTARANSPALNIIRAGTSTRPVRLSDSTH